MTAVPPTSPGTRSAESNAATQAMGTMRFGVIGRPGVRVPPPRTIGPGPRRSDLDDHHPEASGIVLPAERHTPKPPPPPRLPRPLSSGGSLSSRLRLAALPTAAPISRHYTTVQLRMWHLDRLAADCALVTSELVTNAVAATNRSDMAAGAARKHTVPTIMLRLRFTPTRLFCEIWDSSLDPPMPPDPVELDNLDNLDDFGETGRGLLLVAGCSDDWGYYYSPFFRRTGFRRTGKIVWAAFDVDPRETRP